MQVVELKNKNIKLVADENKMIRSKAMHFDEESRQDVPDVQGEKIYLGKNDVVENYEEIERGGNLSGRNNWFDNNRWIGFDWSDYNEYEE